MTLTLRPLSALGGGKAASGKGKTAANGHTTSEVSASCLATEECGMRIPSHTDDQRSSGLDLDDEVVTFRCGGQPRVSLAIHT